MKKVKIFTVDAFTREMFKGNPAGVVPFADELTHHEMKQIAKEINLSETAFILQSDKADFKIKYFTPLDEIDFCGHATIALSWILGTQYDYQTKVEQLTLETNVGIITIDWEMKDNQLDTVVMTQVEPQIKDYKGEQLEILTYLGLTMDDYENKYPMRLAYTGNWHLMVPIKTKKAIDDAKPNYNELYQHNKKYQLSTTHLYTFDTDTDDYLVYTRDFAPYSGVNEDPVTGSANGALAGYFIRENIFEENNSYDIAQGNSFNRLGLLRIKTENNQGKIKVQVGGSAVIVIDGEMKIY